MDRNLPPAWFVLLVDNYESGWTLGGVKLGLLGNSVRQWELQVLGQELSDVLSLDIVGLLQLDNLQNVDRSKSGSVSSSKVGVHGLDSTNSADVSVFLVHVVGSGSGVVSDPDTEVLDLGWVGLADDVEGNDLTRGLLHLVQFLQKVPVSRLGDNIIRSEDSHSVQLWLRHGLGRQLSADDLVFVKTGHVGLVEVYKIFSLKNLIFARVVNPDAKSHDQGWGEVFLEKEFGAHPHRPDASHQDTHTVCIPRESHHNARLYRMSRLAQA
ncbi:hypothetical protein OGAPHI_005072 [Ogataea philodendri]|uniref:Uncharacterized protein n=1 Tax=Ogataea philodendri TaxID=1378263 RepID=A0A9P8P291_9ASCO|nr:uncharacterized protein OGAPHI_005072 [Ogataea philodendri]KAH3663671.1 hypothetical protein OGAPHI_005072 [Ogataea philodendri]